MNNYTLTYSFKKVADNAYAVEYSCVDQNGTRVLGEREWIYNPRKGQFETPNEVRSALTSVFYARITQMWKLPGKTKIICTNPDSDFLSKGEMFRRTLKKHCIADAAAQAASTAPASVVPQKDNEALYEVVNKNGVWTIVKHAEPLYTAEQAKTVLFQKIVNG